MSNRATTLETPQKQPFDKEANDMIANHHAKLQRVRDHYSNASEKFLAAWIRAIALIGPEYFHCVDIDSYKNATDKDQIRPNTELIEERINVCSVGEGVFIGVVMSFFNDKWGAGICDAFGYHGIGGAANRLELDEMDIAMELFNSHTGW